MEHYSESNIPKYKCLQLISKINSEKSKFMGSILRIIHCKTSIILMLYEMKTCT